MTRTAVPAPPTVLDLPVGLDATGTRTETDPMGSVQVPAEHYWGAETERSLVHFAIGGDRMPVAVCRAYGSVKKASALVNARHGLLPQWKADLVAQVCDEVASGALDAQFPLYVWQTGSGTQSNMNVNEVVANRCIQLLGGTLGSKTPVHPNDDVNRSQSSNDTFPTAMHLAILQAVTTDLAPSVRALHAAIDAKAVQWAGVVKIGRTHLEDAVPLTVGQEWSGYARQLADGLARLLDTLPALYEIALGGTAVGNGPERTGGLRRRGRCRTRHDHRLSVGHGSQQVRSPRRARRGGGRLGGPACARRAADEDRERHPLGRLRTPLRHW
jgi:fumarate hydratase class II